MLDKQSQRATQLKGLISPNRDHWRALISNRLLKTDPALAAQLLALSGGTFAFLQGSKVPIEITHLQEKNSLFFRRAWKQNASEIQIPSSIEKRLEEISGGSETTLLAVFRSAHRKIETLTVFFQKGTDPGVRVDKFSVSGVEHGFFSGISFDLNWHAIQDVPLSKGTSLRVFLLENLAASKFESFALELTTFLSASLHRFPNSEDPLVDALFTNAFFSGDRPKVYHYFDLEWSMDRKMPPSGYVFRNVVALAGYHSCFRKTHGLNNLKEWYEHLCKRLGIDPQYSDDLQHEAELQSMATTFEDPAPIRLGINAVLTQPFGCPDQSHFRRHVSQIRRYCRRFRKKNRTLVAC